MSELTREIKWTLEEQFPPVWVQGEISNFVRHSSGHFYFTIKDADAQLSCVMWRGRNQNLIFRPEDGLKVLVMGNLTVYERQGRYQLDVMLMQPAGIGELQKAFEALKRKLQAEGLFDQEHKRPLPEFPASIGVVTSPTGAAIRDIVSVIQRRFPGVPIVLRPVRVQGEGAAQEIVQGIQDLNAYNQVDVIIVGRGGGSLEDLWAFNEEIVARAIYASHLPIISAVGHEIDFSISDFVADMRAPTPSAAAELVVRDREELRQIVFHNGLRIWQSIGRSIQSGKEKLTSLMKSYGFRDPYHRIRESRLRLDDLQRLMCQIFDHCLVQNRSRVSQIQAQLEALNPDAVLKRGYSITSRVRDGHVVMSAEDVKIAESLHIQFSEGAVRTSVESKE